MARRKKPQYPNLARGPRSLRLTVRQRGGRYSAEDAASVIGSVVVNMEGSIRDGVLSRWESAVVRYARQNIRLGNVGTGYELSGKLASTIKVEPSRGDRAIVSYGEGLPYGNALDRPKGTSTTIRSTRGKLVFPNRKGLAYQRGKQLYVPTHFAVPAVQYPGKAFFTDAVERANGNLKKYIADEVKLVRPDYAKSAYRITAQGGKVWGMGRIKKANVRRELLVDERL